MNLNSFPTQQITDEYRDPNFPPNYHSSSSVSCHDFFSLSREYYDHPRIFHQPDEINNHAYNHGGSSTNKIENDLRLSLWGKEDQTSPEKAPNMSMSSKNIKSPADRIALKITPTLSTIDRKPSYLETDQFSSSNNSSPHSPIRVCSDCNTTKTPLWRSGPKGPKSLCNACGIRQRKARRAMAAAAAAAASAVGTNQPTNPKLQHHKAEKTPRSGHSLQVKKRSRMTNTGDGGSIPSPGSGENKKVCFEDMLINLSKKLAVVHRVFPEEEKDAAILLMALSYGLVHG